MLPPNPPMLATLRKYGLTPADWLAILQRQGFKCPVCMGPLDNNRKLAIDHAHVAGFRARRRLKSGRRVRVMKPADRPAHVRGILHAWCNRFVRSWLTPSRAKAIAAYLEAHELRQSADAGQ